MYTEQLPLIKRTLQLSSGQINICEGEQTRDAYSDASGVSSSEASQGTNHGRAGAGNVNATSLRTHFYR